MPCETQAPPDLRTNVQAAPKATEVDYALPAVQEAIAAAQERATEWLDEELDEVGVEIPIGDTPLEPSQLPLLQKARP